MSSLPFLLALVVQVPPPLSAAASGADAEHSTRSEPATASNRLIVDQAFAEWKAGKASFYALLTDEASVTIAGESVNSGTFLKAAFLRDRAAPFQARFRTPLLPTRWTVWAVGDEVIVRWDSRATACDGRPYTNSYAYFITMKNGRATALTMFLDMGAFDDVWNRCAPLQIPEKKR